MEYYIVRGRDSGVFAGNIAERSGQEVTMTNVHKLWWWEGACAVEQIAVDGTVAPEGCKFTVTVEEMIITDAIQIIKATEKAERVIKGVKEWKR